MFSNLNIKKTNHRVHNILLILILLLMLTTNLASAAGEDASVFVTRLTGTNIGIKIIFPEPISGNFWGVIHGHHFSCATIPPDTLYCIGPLATWVDAATLHIYEHPSGNVIFSKVISSPKKIGGSEETPTDPQPEPEPEDPECPPGECQPQ